MPLKKGNQTKPVSEPGMAPVVMDWAEPILSAISIIDKKARNLEKRKNKLTQLRVCQKDGTTLDKGQEEAITKIKDVDIQLDLVKDLQKQFAGVQSEYQKYRKRQQRAEKAQAKEQEQEAVKRSVNYTMRVQDILNLMGEEDKENFRTGMNGAVKLSDDELTHIDDLFKVLCPSREANLNYETDLSKATENIVLLADGSSLKEVLGSNFKDLHDILDKIDTSGYFDRPSEPQDEQDSEDADDYKSADDQSAGSQYEENATSPSNNFTEEVDVPPEVPPMVEPEHPVVHSPNALPEPVPVGDQTSSQSFVPMITQANNNIMNFMPPAPSPTFPALDSPVVMTHSDGFSFMHESEVERKQSIPLPSSPLSTSQQITHQAPPPQVQSHSNAQNLEFAQYANRVGISSPGGDINVLGGSNLNDPINQNAVQVSNGQAITDVTTGQPNPSVYQSTTNAMTSSSAPPTNQSMGMMTEAPGGSMQFSSVMQNTVEASTVYHQQQQQQHHQNIHNPYYRTSAPHNRGSRGVPSQNGGGNGGPRRMGGQGGGPKSGYGAGGGRGGRAFQGGYESQGQSYSSKSYGGGSGRPNYRANSGGQKKS